MLLGCKACFTVFFVIHKLLRQNFIKHLIASNLPLAGRGVSLGKTLEGRGRSLERLCKEGPEWGEGCVEAAIFRVRAEGRGRGWETPGPGRGAGPQGAGPQDCGRVRRPGRTPGFRRGTAVSPPSPLDRTSAPRRRPQVELPTAAALTARGQTVPAAAGSSASRRLFGLPPALRPRPQGRSQ